MAMTVVDKDCTEKAECFVNTVAEANYERGYKEGYAKAIEEFAEKLKEEFSRNIFSDEEKFKYARKEQEQICAQNMTWKMAKRLVDYFAKELKGERYHAIDRCGCVD